MLKLLDQYIAIRQRCQFTKYAKGAAVAPFIMVAHGIDSALTAENTSAANQVRNGATYLSNLDRHQVAAAVGNTGVVIASLALTRGRPVAAETKLIGGTFDLGVTVLGKLAM